MGIRARNPESGPTALDLSFFPWDTARLLLITCILFILLGCFYYAWTSARDVLQKVNNRHSHGDNSGSDRLRALEGLEVKRRQSLRRMRGRMEMVRVAGVGGVYRDVMMLDMVDHPWTAASTARGRMATISSRGSSSTEDSDHDQLVPTPIEL